MSDRRSPASELPPTKVCFKMVLFSLFLLTPETQISANSPFLISHVSLSEFN